MKTMLSSTLLLCVILAVWFIPFGYSLKCYSYFCTNSSVGPNPSCAPPQEITCPSIPGSPMAPDRCMTQRIMLESSVPSVGVITIHQEVRICSYSFQCQRLRDAICNKANSTGNLKKCEVGCCQGDLCNSGGSIPTQAPGPTGPSGADLSCLACSNIPRVGVQTSCNSPISQTCGAGPLPFLPQDRCMTVKGVVRVPGLSQPKEFEMKNCSYAPICRPGAFCTVANNSVRGAIESCQVSCCFGNLCNGNGAMKTAAVTTAAVTTAARTEVGGTTAGGATAGGTASPPVSSATTGTILTGLTCFSAFISYFYFIVMV